MLADIRAGGGHGVVLSDKAHRVRIPSFAHKGNIARNIDARWTQRDAGNRVLQRGEAPVVSDMVHIVVSEALEAAQHQLRRVTADGTIGGRDNRARRFLNGIDRQHGARPIEDLPHQRRELTEADAAGNAFAARLGMAQLQKGQGHINGTQSRWAGRNSALHIFVKMVNDGLGPACGFDIQSAQGWFTPSVIILYHA